MLVEPVGKLTVATGPMFSGKTEELLRRVRRAFHADIGVQIFSPSTDTRREGRLVSHAGTDLVDLRVPFQVSVLHPYEAFAARVRANVRYVALDEAQFFASSAITEVLTLLHRGVSVFASGLDRDFRGEPFGIVPQLLAHADEVLKFTAICAHCKSEQGSMSLRLAESTEQVLIGDRDAYAPLCRACWVSATSR